MMQRTGSILKNTYDHLSNGIAAGVAFSAQLSDNTPPWQKNITIQNANLHAQQVSQDRADRQQDRADRIAAGKLAYAYQKEALGMQQQAALVGAVGLLYQTDPIGYMQTALYFLVSSGLINQSMLNSVSSYLGELAGSGTNLLTSAVKAGFRKMTPESIYASVWTTYADVAAKDSGDAIGGYSQQQQQYEYELGQNLLRSKYDLIIDSSGQVHNTGSVKAFGERFAAIPQDQRAQAALDLITQVRNNADNIVSGMTDFTPRERAKMLKELREITDEKAHVLATLIANSFTEQNADANDPDEHIASYITYQVGAALGAAGLLGGRVISHISRGNPAMLQPFIDMLVKPKSASQDRTAPAIDRYVSSARSNTRRDNSAPLRSQAAAKAAFAAMNKAASIKNAFQAMIFSAVKVVGASVSGGLDRTSAVIFSNEGSTNSKGNSTMLLDSKAPAMNSSSFAKTVNSQSRKQTPIVQQQARALAIPERRQRQISRFRNYRPLHGAALDQRMRAAQEQARSVQRDGFSSKSNFYADIPGREQSEDMYAKRQATKRERKYDADYFDMGTNSDDGNDDQAESNGDRLAHPSDSGYYKRIYKKTRPLLNAAEDLIAKTPIGRANYQYSDLDHNSLFLFPTGEGKSQDSANSQIFSNMLAGMPSTKKMNSVFGGIDQREKLAKHRYADFNNSFRREIRAAQNMIVQNPKIAEDPSVQAYIEKAVRMHEAMSEEFEQELHKAAIVKSLQPAFMAGASGNTNSVSQAQRVSFETLLRELAEYRASKFSQRKFVKQNVENFRKKADEVSKRLEGVLPQELVIEFGNLRGETDRNAQSYVKSAFRDATFGGGSSALEEIKEEEEPDNAGVMQSSMTAVDETAGAMRKNFNGVVGESREDAKESNFPQAEVFRDPAPTSTTTNVNNAPLVEEINTAAAGGGGGSSTQGIRSGTYENEEQMGEFIRQETQSIVQYGSVTQLTSVAALMQDILLIVQEHTNDIDDHVQQQLRSLCARACAIPLLQEIYAGTFDDTFGQFGTGGSPSNDEFLQYVGEQGGLLGTVGGQGADYGGETSANQVYYLGLFAYISKYETFVMTAIQEKNKLLLTKQQLDLLAYLLCMQAYAIAITRLKSELNEGGGEDVLGSVISATQTLKANAQSEDVSLLTYLQLTPFQIITRVRNDNLIFSMSYDERYPDQIIEQSIQQSVLEAYKISGLALQLLDGQKTPEAFIGTQSEYQRLQQIFPAQLFAELFDMSGSLQTLSVYANTLLDSTMDALVAHVGKKVYQVGEGDGGAGTTTDGAFGQQPKSSSQSLNSTPYFQGEGGDDIKMESDLLEEGKLDSEQSRNQWEDAWRSQPPGTPINSNESSLQARTDEQDAIIIGGAGESIARVEDEEEKVALEGNIEVLDDANMSEDDYLEVRGTDSQDNIIDGGYGTDDTEVGRKTAGGIGKTLS